MSELRKLAAAAGKVLSAATKVKRLTQKVSANRKPNIRNRKKIVDPSPAPVKPAIVNQPEKSVWDRYVAEFNKNPLPVAAATGAGVYLGGKVLG